MRFRAELEAGATTTGFEVPEELVEALYDLEAGVRRFIACDPDGEVVNVLSHR